MSEARERPVRAAGTPRALIACAAVFALWLIFAGVLPFLHYAANVNLQLGGFYVPILMLATPVVCLFLTFYVLAVTGNRYLAGTVKTGLAILLGLTLTALTLFVASKSFDLGAYWHATPECTRLAEAAHETKACHVWGRDGDDTGLHPSRFHFQSYLISDGGNRFTNPNGILPAADLRVAARNWIMEFRHIPHAAEGSFFAVRNIFVHPLGSGFYFVEESPDL